MARIICLLCLCALAVSTAAAEVITLTNDGRTAYRILIDPEATVAEKHAAEELARFLGEVTGAQFPIETGVDAGFDPSVVVGPGRAARKLAPDLDFDSLDTDGLVIETRNPHLILAGDRPRGTLYAVYTFLEDMVGCRWWAPDATYIPDIPTLQVTERHDRFVPRLEYRETFWWPAFDADWAVRNKNNGHRAHLDEKRGGKVDYGGLFVHTFNRLVPPGEYFEEHPEWFSERNGERIGGSGERTQLCLTNSELKDFVVQRVLDWLENHPDADIVSVSQNDWGNRCQCEKCRALEEKEGSPAGPLLHFVNYVADQVGEEYPDVAIDTLAYHYTRKPPEHVRPRENVIVRLCSIECSFLQPLTAEVNASFRDDIVGWSKICDRLYIWDYTTNFAHYIMPHPNLRVLGPNVRFFVEHGVKGIFEQGAYQSPAAEFAHLRSWVLAKLLWEPYRDPESLIDAFLEGYYGAAAPAISEYIDLLHDTAEATEHYLSIGSSVDAPFFNLEFMAKAEKLFDEAEAAVADDPQILRRVRLARLPLRYVWAMRWHEFQRQANKEGIEWPGPDSYVKNCKTFMDVARAHEATKLSEGRPIESFEKRTIGLGRHEAPRPPGTEELGPDQFADLQDYTFRLWREGTGAIMKADEDASDGVSVMMPATHHQWAVQQPLSGLKLEEAADYAVHASIKIIKKGHEGQACTFGIYDVENSAGVASGEVECADIQDAGYHTYTIHEGKLSNRMYIWVAPAQNPDNVDSVWVDRFWVVRQSQEQ